MEIIASLKQSTVADIAYRVTFSSYYENGQQTGTIRRATGQQAASNADKGNGWHISAVADNAAQLQRGEQASFELQLDSASGIAQSTFFGSPVHLKLQKFSAQ